MIYTQLLNKEHQAEIGKKSSKGQTTPWGLTFAIWIYFISSSLLSSKTNMRYPKKCAKNICVCFNEIVWLIIMKIKLKMKHRSHRYDINKTRLRHGYKYAKYKICLSMMVMYNSQHLSSIWSWIHKKLSNTEAELKKHCLQRSLFLWNWISWKFCEILDKCTI